MTQEALRMAHKALIGLSIKHDEMTDEGMDAITAIEKALAKEKTLQALHSENERLGLYRDAYVQPEPVAWMDADGNVSDNNDHKCFPIPLYTTPPQRTWVGLTDADISKISQRFGIDHDDSWTDLKQAIEAKLKERNDHSI